MNFTIYKNFYLRANQKVKFGAIEISRGSKAQRREVIRK